MSDFLHTYGAARLVGYVPQPSFDPDKEPEETVDHDYERPREHWRPITPEIPRGWDGDDWSGTPRRFVDGKDVGETVAWIKAPGGYPVPIRLAQVGSVVIEREGRSLRRSYYSEPIEPVVAFVAQPFPWQDVEGFAIALQTEGFRLLTAPPLGGQCSHDFELMRKAAANRTMLEMELLEQAAITHARDVPMVIDGRLEPRRSGFSDANDPVYGVIKTHKKNYLHPKGIEAVYKMTHGQRTPLFCIRHPNGSSRLEVVSWFVRLGAQQQAAPHAGLIRIEVARVFFEQQQDGTDFANKLSHICCRYRSRSHTYDRAACSLHPIVRAEESLGACFCNPAHLISRFCHQFNL